jgi:hypothetical protein
VEFAQPKPPSSRLGKACVEFAQPKPPSSRLGKAVYIKRSENFNAGLPFSAKIL